MVSILECRLHKVRPEVRTETESERPEQRRENGGEPLANGRTATRRMATVGSTSPAQRWRARRRRELSTRVERGWLELGEPLIGNSARCSSGNRIFFCLIILLAYNLDRSRRGYVQSISCLLRAQWRHVATVQRSGCAPRNSRRKRVQTRGKTKEIVFHPLTSICGCHEGGRGWEQRWHLRHPIPLRHPAHLPSSPLPAPAAPTAPGATTPAPQSSSLPQLGPVFPHP